MINVTRMRCIIAPTILVGNSSEHDGNVAKNIAKWALRLQSEIQSQMFDAFDRIFVIRFLAAHKMAFNTTGILGGAAV